MAERPDGPGGAGGAPQQSGAVGVGAGAGDLGVDYAWLQEQLAELGRQLGAVALEDEFEDEYEEWDDPSGGLLSSIFEACENDTPDELAPLLEKLKGSGWGVNAIGPDGDTPLHTAALYGSEACVELLLAAGARADALNPEDGTSVLHDAAAGGYTTILRILVDAARTQLLHGADGPGAGGAAGDEPPAAEATADSADGRTDSPSAVAQGQEQQDQGQEQEQQQQQQQQERAGEAGGEDVVAAASRPQQPKTLLELINAADSEGETALHNAARGNHVEAVRFLLALGADPLAEAKDGSLPVDEPEDEGVAAILQEAMDALEGAGAGDGREEGDDGVPAS